MRHAAMNLILKNEVSRSPLQMTQKNRQTFSPARRWLGALFCFIFSSCLAPPQNFPVHSVPWELANPEPTGLEGLMEQNTRHRVLVSVLDAGIDSAHPRLQPNLHPFVLTPELHAQWQVPLSQRRYGYGLDLVGNDFFPHYAVIAEEEPNAEATATPSPGPSPLYEEISAKLMSGTHGTHVSQLATLGNPAIGLIPVKVLPLVARETPGGPEAILDSALNREAIFEAQLVDFIKALEKGLDFSVSNHADIASLSLGVNLEELSDPARRARLQTLIEERINVKLKTTWSSLLIIAAAGNERTLLDRPTLSIPATLEHPDLIAVGALNKDRSIAHYSNFSRFVDVYMQGSDIRSAVPLALGGWENESGTSMATPLVANLAARIKLILPTLSPREVRALILNTARLVEAPIQPRPEGESSTEGTATPLPQTAVIRIADFKRALATAQRLKQIPPSAAEARSLLTPPFEHGHAPRLVLPGSAPSGSPN
jgi:subtilisin family serine protease